MDVNVLIKKIKGDSKKIPNKSLRISDWLSWYRGDVMGFHNYRIYNGVNYIELRRKSMQAAKFICEMWANLLLNERCDIVIPKAAKIKLDDYLTKTNFWVKANGGIEKAFALSHGAFVLTVKNIEVGDKGTIKAKDNTSIGIDFVNALKITPITIEDKNVTECAFTSINSDTTNFSIHVKNAAGNYEIHNYVIDNASDKIINEYVFDTKSPLQWFWIVRPNIESNAITESQDDELGVSVFANSIDTLKALDSKYDGFDKEYVLGKKRIFVAAEAWTVNITDGKMSRTFDPNEDLYYQLPTNDKGEQVIQTKSDELRYDAYIKGINTELNWLSMKCGMGETFLHFDGSNIATATQVISENSTLYRNLKKHEILLESILKSMTEAIIYASNTFTKNGIGEVNSKDIKIKFDDSIIEDKGAEMARDKADVTSGIMSKIDYRIKWYNEDEKTATQYVFKHFRNEIIDKYSNALTTGLMTPKAFVDECYQDYNDEQKAEMVLYVEEFITKEPAFNPFEPNEGENEEDEEQEEEPIATEA